MTRKLALIIGNSQYDDANLSQLTAPAADVRALDELLRAPEIGGFDAVQTLENRSFDGVQLAIADFFADKKPDDLLLLYFSGHGLLDPQGRLYLAVKNTRNDRLSGSAIASLFLKDEMDNSRAKRQVLILDCCQSGAFGQGAKGAPGAQAITNATFEGRGRVVLTATDKTQPAWEGNRIIGGVETSLFTHFIGEGLTTGSAADEGGRITPTRLYDYVFPKVVEVVPTQKPRLIVYDREGGDIVIARSPRLPAPKLTPELQQAVDSVFAGVRAGVVEELSRLLKSTDRGTAQAAREAL
ncbi:MAG: caspase family protein, partial [Chloroflexota bacterium]